MGANRIARRNAGKASTKLRRRVVNGIDDKQLLAEYQRLRDKAQADVVEGLEVLEGELATGDREERETAMREQGFLEGRAAVYTQLEGDLSAAMAKRSGR